MIKPIEIKDPQSAELLLRGHPNGGWTVEAREDEPYTRQTLAAYGSADDMLADLARVLVTPAEDPLSRVPLSTLRGLVEEREVNRA